MQELKLHSQHLDEELSLPVYCSKPVTPLYKHLVIIAQDGQDYFMFGKIGRVIDELGIRAVVIGVPYRNVSDRYEKYHPNGKKREAYMRFLANELAPLVDEQFSTYQMGATRILVGDSLAGTVSLLTAMTYPHTFGKVVMQSPYVNDDVMTHVQSFTDWHLLALYHSVGIKETEVKTTDGAVRNFIEPNRALAHVLQAKQSRYHYEEFDGDHSWTYWQPNLPIGLKKVIEM
ncbi:esterase family protein [Anoxybacillus sp. LAT_35]|uniref:alpha/beta hydrolase n=1 Tax=unclassified Anoxybacillus TaxID=2639704 RepID=UPI001EDB9C51|nr:MULTISPECIES: alpha/beta hydrolase-fold protein [unclassified Anoxybacillus]MCG5025956.1 esterase family protein [Anoxybacillus flavithermus]MCG3085564.1 esterase family protein [Anoxybacillus sp. LAT27]MCG6170822.1 esterase family protein [Anoxybacillus sp. LAT_11]MCG6175823.1 esterase family protein [Anoxybacillus sp. LAT_31]MCG6177526.1 esterase family protein [Anoxybacillus sp. LAT_35]